MNFTTTAQMQGHFETDAAGETWYRLDAIDAAEPFFMVLAGDSDLWAFVSSAGSLAAGRHDAEGSFLPYETVDKIHRRWEHTGPRTWIRVHAEGREPWLWTPFAPRLDGRGGARALWKNLSSTRIRFREDCPEAGLAFEYEWFTSADLGLVRSARLLSLDATRSVRVEVLDAGGKVVDTQLMSNLSAGLHAFEWDGKVGERTLDPGAYRLRVAATGTSGEVGATVFQAVPVQAVTRGADGTPVLQLGRAGSTPLDQVRGVL